MVLSFVAMTMLKNINRLVLGSLDSAAATDLLVAPGRPRKTLEVKSTDDLTRVAKLSYIQLLFRVSRLSGRFTAWQSIRRSATHLSLEQSRGYKISGNPSQHRTTHSIVLMASRLRTHLSGAPLKITSPPNHGRTASTRHRLEVQCAVKKASLRNIVCSKTLRVKEDRVEEANKLCKGIAELAHREMQDRSNGILAFEVFQDRFDEKHIHFWERYADNTRMGRFNTSEEFQSFMKSIQDCLEEPVGLALYDWKNGQLGPLAVQGGPKGVHWHASMWQG